MTSEMSVTRAPQTVHYAQHAEPGVEYTTEYGAQYAEEPMPEYDEQHASASGDTVCI